MIAFEQRFLGGSQADALARIGELLGAKQLTFQGGPIEAVYKYQDAYGRVVFEKLRYPGKRFVQRQVKAGGGYEYHLNGIAQKPLYHLPEVLTSDEIFIAEGEKDCDNLREKFPRNGNGDGKVTITATTNFDGAGKWRDEYSTFFAGKRCVVFCDNDEMGEKHAEMIARSVSRYAIGTKLVRFPELPPKGDVSDFLLTHPDPHDLIVRIKQTPAWKPPEQENTYFVSVNHFARLAPAEIDWVIAGAIQHGTNSLMLAKPHGGKSMTVADMCLALASGQQWLGMDVRRVMRVGLVSREDWHLATSWRLARLAEGRGLNLDDLEKYLYVNTRVQVPNLLVDNDEHLVELMRAIESRGLDFLVFDVLRKAHNADENNPTEMQRVIEKFVSIQAHTGAQLMLLHHQKKGDATGTDRSRGATVIAGFGESILNLETVEEEGEFAIRELSFDLKAGNKPKPKHYSIVDKHWPQCVNHGDCSCPRFLELVSWSKPEARDRKRSARSER